VTHFNLLGDNFYALVLYIILLPPLISFSFCLSAYGIVFRRESLEFLNQVFHRTDILPADYWTASRQWMSRIL